MASVATEIGAGTTERRSRLLFALVTTSLVTVAGLAAAIQQFVLKFLWDQSAHTRTIGGVLYMLLGMVGILCPLRNPGRADARNPFRKSPRSKAVATARPDARLVPVPTSRYTDGSVRARAATNASKVLQIQGNKV